ncbi:InlB B-repeat-containing protein [Paenibacillus sp. YIM B09110]|uniref:InlB B-repeat-containing protein n=1 Tax=Paenibacillus sp. YIM B09110 TaxID=3126102 RepID=UPI00301CC1AB
MNKWYKRTIVLWLIVCLTVSLIPMGAVAASEDGNSSSTPITWHDATQNAGTAQHSFQDVKPTDWFYNAVTYVQQNGIFSGTGNNSFSPQGTMTRAMYVTVLGRIAGIDASKYTSSAFTDVQQAAWYAPYVQWAVEKGITSGTGPNIFSPNALISREQMATLTLRYFEIENIAYQTGDGVTTKPNDLADISPWAVDAVVKLWQAGVLTGDANGNVNPRAYASRAEAAVFCMRSNEAVKGSGNQIPVDPTPTPTPTPTPEGENAGSGDGGSSGNTNDGTYTITFETNGGSAIASLKLRKGDPLSSLPAPTKPGFIFQGWYKDSAFANVLFEGDSVTGNMTLYARYITSLDSAVTTVPSVSVLDQAPSFTVQVKDATGKMTAGQVLAGIKFESPANPAFAGIVVTGSKGQFTVAAKSGAFEEGNTYQLKLTDTNLSFQGQDKTTTIYVFSIAKQAVMKLPLNPDMIYLSFADVSNMMLNGEGVDAPAIPVITTGIGGSGADLNEANASSGSFDYTGDASIQSGDIVAIYEGVRPDLRSAEDDGSVAYVQIAAINGNSYTYTHADSKKVLVKPDVLPVSTEADTDGDATNHSITVEHVVMNFSDSKYAPLGLNELTVVNEGDFIAFYNGKFNSKATSAGYSLITSITRDAEMLIITYTDVTLDQVTSALDVYQQQAFDGDELLSGADVARLEGRIKQQAVSSGFVDQAADYLSQMALHTDSFQQQYDALAPKAAASSFSRVSVENLTVVPSISSTLNNLSGSGVSVALQVGADIVIQINDESDIVIHLVGTFVEEIKLSLSINGDTEWGLYWIFPYLKDYVITANLDAYTFTGINITAEITTVSHDKLDDVLSDWLQAEDVQNIATELQALIDGVEDTGVDATTLKESYKNLLEVETDWVPLLTQKLVDKSVRVCLGIIEVNFAVDFVVSANVNLTVGIEFNYKSAKRYSATVRIFSFTGSSNTVSLPGDGDYQFKFYVLGTLGLRAGVQVTLQAGIGKVDWNSIGISVEPGVYLNLWGYFYYDLKNAGGVKTTTTIGALYLELGIYLESLVRAQVGDGLLEATLPIYDNTWPLFSAGTQNNVVDFAYSQHQVPSYDLTGRMKGDNLPQLSGNLMYMEVMDIKTGESTRKLFDRSNFTITTDSSDFVYDPVSNYIGISEQLRKKWYDGEPINARGNIIITWNNETGSLSVAPTRSIPVSFTAKVGDTTFVLFPMNEGAPSITLTGQFGTAIDIPADPVYSGHTFAGWYTAQTGGTKYTIPSKMPAPRESRTLYARWTLRTDTPYKVEHYLFKPDVVNPYNPSPGDAKLAATENLTGTTYSKITVADTNRFNAQGYRYGFTQNGSNVGPGYLMHNGSTVVKVYYFPDLRKLTFKTGYGGNAVVGTLTDEIGSKVSWIPVMSRPGYTFVGWSTPVPSVVPSQDTTYTAIWRAKDDTPYRVVHLQQDIAKTKLGLPILGNTYTVVDQEELTGTTDTVTNAVTPKSYEGFTFDSSVTGTLQSDHISGDGSTILKLYYKRNTYTATFNLNGGTIAGSTAPYKLTVPYSARIPQPYVTKGTDVLTGWSPAIPATMPVHDVSFTAQWSEKTAPYKVTHYRPDTTGQYTITEVETLNAPEGTTVTAPPKSYEGFTVDSAVTATVASGVVVDSTSSPLQLKLYYKRNVYNVTLDLDGGTVYAGTPNARTGSYTFSILYGISLTSIPITRAGYIFTGWSPALPGKMPAENIAAVAQWTPNLAISGVSINNMAPAIGDILNAQVTMGDGAPVGNRVTYQWKVETTTSGTFANATGMGNTTASYTVADADMGKRLQVVVTGVSPITGTTTATTNVVSVPITAVTINNDSPAYGDVVTAYVTMGDGSAAGNQVTYQWQVETGAGTGTFKNATGAGHTTASYTIATADVGKKLRVVVSYLGRAAGAVTSEATSAVGVNVTGVTINHTSPKVGNLLTAVVTMADGAPAGNRVTYEWMVQDIVGSNQYVPAAGAGKTTANYTVAAGDVGKKLQVWVYGANEGLGMVMSAATNAVQAADSSSEPLPAWITSAEALDLTSATVTVVSATEVAISGATLTDAWTLPEGVTLNMSNTTMDSYTLTISDGSTLNVSNSTVDGNIETLAGATLNATATTFGEGYYWNIVEGATLNVNGTVTVALAATLIVNGAVNISSGATLINDGAITGDDGTTGVITNNGTITNNTTFINSGTITNKGTITNNGTITNTAGATINNTGGTFTGNDPITI